MKERGKAAETFPDYNSSELPCKKHPSSSSVGICAYCLKDRLIKLVCSDCGEQRLSSCSCSEVSSYRNSCAAEVGSVGRISFLIENERRETKHSHSKPKNGLRSEEKFLLKRSSSSCVGVKRSGLWRIVRLFRKKRDQGCETSVGWFDDKTEMWVFDCVGVSRSRSLCSFRGGSFNDLEESSDFGFSSAKISVVNGDAMIDSERLNGFGETEPRKSGFKCDFSSLDDSGFIDLNLDSSLESKPEFSVLKTSDLPVSVSDLGRLRVGTSLGHHECGGSFGALMGDGIFSNGGSCRITVNDRGVQKDKKGHKVWRWIFRQHPNWRRAS